jgi:glycosyltransferase A (GT-A) superfamily protein (DUF2064 family)
LDGGYYLVGLNREQPVLFDRMTWSHDQVLAQALQKLDSVGVRAKQLPPWFDVDTIDELQRVLLLRGSSRKAMRNTLPLLHGRILKHGNLLPKQRAKAS